MTRSLYRIRIFAENQHLLKDYTVESHEDGEQAVVDTALSVVKGYIQATNVVIDKAIIHKTVNVEKSWAPKITYENNPAESKQIVEI